MSKIKFDPYGAYEAICINNNTNVHFSARFSTEHMRWLYINKCRHGKEVSIVGLFYNKSFD